MHGPSGRRALPELQCAAVGEGVAEGDGVDEFEAGAGGDAGGEAGDLHAEGGELLGQKQGGGFAAGVGAKAKNDLGHLILLRPLEESGNFQLLWSDSVQRREQSAEDVVLPLEGTGAFEIQDIGRVFDDAEEGSVPVFIATDLAKPLFAKESALRAGFHLGLGFLHRVGEVVRSAGRGGEKVKGEALGGAGPDAGQFAQGGDEAKGGGRVVGHPRRAGSALVDDPGVELLQRGLDGGIVEEGLLAGGGGRGGGLSKGRLCRGGSGHRFWGRSGNSRGSRT